MFDLTQLRASGILRTTRNTLQDAASRRESVGAPYRGFMSEVKEELEVGLVVIETRNNSRAS